MANPMPKTIFFVIHYGKPNSKNNVFSSSNTANPIPKKVFFLQPLWQIQFQKRSFFVVQKFSICETETNDSNDKVVGGDKSVHQSVETEDFLQMKMKSRNLDWCLDTKRLGRKYLILIITHWINIGIWNTWWEIHC